MSNNNHQEWQEDIEAIETQEWLDSLDYVLQEGGPERVQRLLEQLGIHAHNAGVRIPFSANTPYINTIPRGEEPPFPGNREIERRIKSIIRWNALAMVVRANRADSSIGGHISTFASAATLYEIGFNHFFRAGNEEQEGDIIYFQGHAAPGIYSRAFLEGRLSVEKLENFRKELSPGGGLSSYPHPWLMPEFWQFPTVSMGLGPIMSIYQARFNRYLENRGLKPKTDAKVWAFLGDGETDEPETLGAIALASREKLDNLIFVINCNLQRLDGPVRGNGKVIQELETVFRGAGWNVIKVIWGSSWDVHLEKDYGSALVERMGQIVDGEYQKFGVESPEYVREHFFAPDPRLKELVENLTDDEIRKLKRGGHDPAKVYAAYKAAMEHKGAPTVILAKTVKGYGLGEAGEGKNITHQQKKMNEQELREFRARFGIPISDEDVAKAPFYTPSPDSTEMKYLHEQRQKLGGYVPSRLPKSDFLNPPSEKLFEEFYAGTDGREISTTMAFVRLLTKLLRDKEIGKLVVPIVPDEARTFGMEALFRQCGIYASQGQLYEPVDSDSLLYYKEAKDGQILEEGITEAGSMASFIAAGTAYSTHGINTIPFFIYYSMFGFQRIGDLIWAAGDMRTRGFMIGATAGRTTLAGEGLQHQDGHSHVLASTIPNLMTYDIAYAYEMAVIIREGIRRMYEEQESIFYYLTVGNENYAMPPIPDEPNIKENILKGMYRFKKAEIDDAKHRVQLLGSGAMMGDVLKAQAELAERGIAADVWNVTSYKELRWEGLDVERWNMLHPDQQPRVPYAAQCLDETADVIVASSDYMKVMPDSVTRWSPRPIVSLGTDGFGRSESREKLRDFFEVDYRYVTLAALTSLHRQNKIKRDEVDGAIEELEINPEKLNPLKA